MKDERRYAARGTDAPWYQGWDISDDERATFRATTLASQEAKRRALRGECDQPKHPINTPNLNTQSLMPVKSRNGLRALSLFSGGGGLDIGFDRAGFRTIANYELVEGAAAVLRDAHPDWTVFGGAAGDVTGVDWTKYRGQVDVLHGGPPCQPFSHAGRRNGANDLRDMIPEIVRAVREIQPAAFVIENVSGLVTKRFGAYVDENIIQPLSDDYDVTSFLLEAADFGVPQNRKRVFFVGFRDRRAARNFAPPAPTHLRDAGDVRTMLPVCMGARKALGLPDIGFDALAPTLRSGWTGPRHTTSVLNSVTALRLWNQLRIWPNGVALSREAASNYVAKNGHFRLSIPDCLVLQGFPGSWPVGRPAYFALGLIGNSVAPPMAYHLAREIEVALRQANL